MKLELSVYKVSYAVVEELSGFFNTV